MIIFHLRTKPAQRIFILNVNEEFRGEGRAEEDENQKLAFHDDLGQIANLI